MLTAPIYQPVSKLLEGRTTFSENCDCGTLGLESAMHCYILTVTL